MRRRWLRLLVALSLVALGALQIEGLLRAFRAEGRVREQALHAAREAVHVRREEIAAALLPGSEDAFRAANYSDADIATLTSGVKERIRALDLATSPVNLAETK